MDLMFREPETFEAPNLEGNMIKYVVMPMQVENIPTLLKYIELRQEKNKTKVKNDKSRKKPKTKKESEDELIENSPFFNKEIGELTKFLIDEGVKSVDTNEPLPTYNRSPSIVMQIIDKIIRLTMDGGESSSPLQEEGSTPTKKS